MLTVLAFAVLVVVLGAVARGRSARLELVVTVAGAALVVLTGAVAPAAARHAVAALGPTVGFLAAIFVVAAVADRAGLFGAAGAIVRRSATSPRRLVAVVGLMAAVITAVLSLDATAVLFTPVVVRAVTSRRAARDAALLTTVQVANAGSLLFPVSNLTNLIVLPATGLSFAAFAAHMTLPTLAALAVVGWVGVRRAPRASRAPAVAATQAEHTPPERTAPADPAPTDPAPTGGIDGVGLTVGVAIVVLLLALVALSFVGVAAPAAAGVGAGLLVLGAVATRRMRPFDALRATAPAFLVFVLALGVVVAAAREHGLGGAVSQLVPSGDGLVALLAVAAVAAVLANAVNNLPATLVLLAVLPHGDVGQLLAMLIGVNVGPNLTYSGSLATLLWRRVVREAGAQPPGRAFYGFGVVATPVALVAATGALWLTLRAL